MWSSIKTLIVVLAVCLLCMAVIPCFSVGDFAPITVELSTETFTETAGAIDNPNRGLYSIFGFYITDQEEDYQTQIDRLFCDDKPINLVMSQINLAH